MTYEEVKKIRDDGVIEDVVDLLVLSRMIDKAIDKQIPKKVTHEVPLHKCCTCPNCKNVVDEFTDFAGKKVRVTYNHCRFCGQALDWSDKE